MENHIVVPLGEIINSGEYKDENLIKAFEKFECPLERDLEDFLVKNALRYERGNIGKTYLFINEAQLKKAFF